MNGPTFSLAKAEYTTHRVSQQFTVEVEFKKMNKTNQTPRGKAMIRSQKTIKAKRSQKS